MAEDPRSPVSCLPWWHDLFTGPGMYTVLASGCRTVNGNVACKPESMRAAAEARLRALGHNVTLSLGAYTLARYMSSEVGGGTAATPEERMAVTLAAINKARTSYKLASPESAVVRLLLCRQKSSNPHFGWYGPIHGSGGVESAPYGRWASTSQDPTVGAALIAIFALSGQAGDFVRGGFDQFGPDASHEDMATKLRSRARQKQYWIGPLAGVRPRRTFIFAPRTFSASSPEGKQMIAAGLAATKAPHPAIPTMICPKPAGAGAPVREVNYRPAMAAAGTVAFAAAIGWAVSRLA